MASEMDPETGSYTLKRWKVTKVGAVGEPLEVTLRPDNRAAKPFVRTPPTAEFEVVAEYLETVG